MATFTLLYGGRNKITFTADALYPAFRERVVWDGETSRDEIWAGQLGNAHKTLAQQPNSKEAQRLPAPVIVEESLSGGGGGFFGVSASHGLATIANASAITAIVDTPPVASVIADGAETSYAPSQLSDTAMEQSDSFTHTKPRDRWKLLTYIEFYTSAEVGDAQTMSGTTGNGNAEVTVPNVQTLVVGQKVSGAGVPAGARIVAIKRASQIVDSATPSAPMSDKIILSHQCTAGATVELTFTGSVLLAACPARDFDGVTNGTVGLAY